MEEHKAKKINIESIYEDLSVLKLVKYRLQNKRKDFSKNCEMLMLTKTDYNQQIDYWDVLMFQIKEMALDVHEERKWKKGIAYVLSNQIASKLKEKKSKMKLDELYRKCLCLFISMSVNYNYSDISMGKINKKMNKALNDYIKNVTDTESFISEFTHWKKKIKDIKDKLEKKYDINAKKAKNFLKIINLMENMILMQEETIKKINTINQNNELEKSKKMNESKDENKKSLETFLMDVDLELSTSHKVENPFESLPSMNELDFMNINKEINNMMLEISEELGNYDILFNNPNNMNPHSSLNMQSIALNDSQNISNHASQSFQLTRYNSSSSISYINSIQNINIAQNRQNPINSSTNQSLLQISIRNSRYLSPTRSTCENEIIESINPKQLFYDTNFQDVEMKEPKDQSQSNADEKGSNSIIHEKNECEILKNYLEKFTNNDKIDVLSYYNYKKLYKYHYNKNFFYEDYEKVFSSIFKPIISIEPNQDDRMFIENNVDNLKNRFDKILKEPEVLKLFNFKFEKFTILQKLFTLWGLINYGFAYFNILSEIPNIFSFTKSITYDSDEIVNFINKILEDYKVDSFISCFENVKYLNYDHFNNFSKGNSAKLSNINLWSKKDFGSEKYIYNLDPPMLNNTNWDFYYNKKIFDTKKNKNESINEKILKPYNEVIDNYPIVPAKESDKKKITEIRLIINNPIYSLENKKILFYLYKDFIKKFCEKVESLFYETQLENKKNTGANFNYTNYSAFNGFTSSISLNNNPTNGQQSNKKNSKVSNGLPSVNNIFLSSNNTPNKSNGIKEKECFVQSVNLNKETLLAELSIGEDKIDPFNVDSLASEKLNNTKPNNKQSIIEGVSFYSQNMIQKEWEIMRTQWYQNNTQFKPKFRKYCKKFFTLDKSITTHLVNNPSNHSSNTIPMLRNLSDNKS